MIYKNTTMQTDLEIRINGLEKDTKRNRRLLSFLAVGDQLVLTESDDIGWDDMWVKSRLKRHAVKLMPKSFTFAAAGKKYGHGSVTATRVT